MMVQKLYSLLLQSLISLSCWLVMTSLPAQALALSDTQTEVLAQQMLSQHIRPGYARLLKSGEVLQGAIEKLCMSPSASGKKKVDAAFFSTLKGFAGVEHLRFGPMVANNRKDRLMFWPDRKSLGLKQVKKALAQQDKSVLSLKGLQGKSVALQGLTALEYILFGKGQEKLVASSKDGAFRCGYAFAISKNVVQIAGEVQAGWSDSAKITQDFLHPNPKSDLYMSHKEVVRELFLSMLTGFKLAKDFKIKLPLGKSLEKARPWTANFWRSGQSFQVVAANLGAMQDMLTKGGFAKIADMGEPGVSDGLKFELNYVVTTLLSFKKPIKQVVTDKAGRAKLEALLPALSNIYSNAGGAIAKATDMTAGFNSLDGD